MPVSNKTSVINEQTKIKGNLKNGHRLEIFGYVEGEVVVKDIVIHEGGKLFGSLRADKAVIGGTFQGEVSIKNLLQINRSGSVTGTVQYGQLSLESGGELSAEVRNIPPEIGGDLHLNVTRGNSVPITLADLSAFDPDDKAEDLTFTITNPKNGIVAFANAPKNPISKFTQADLEAGKVMFVHNGAGTNKASFDVVVADDDGATSGGAKTVAVDVRS